MTRTVPWQPNTIADLRECLDRITADGTVPGGVIAHGTFDSEPGFLASGVVAPECGDARPGPDTVYDVASLTKVLAGWPLVGTFLRNDLDTPVSRLLPGIPAEAPGGRVTVRQILAHTSGLRADTRLDQYRNRTEPLAELICGEDLIAEPGAGHRYINRGFILLGLALAHSRGRRLDELAAEFWQRLGMTNTTYGPVARSAQVAPTEQRLPGAPRLWGMPHDDNAALLGGVAGHAGVFTTPADLAAFAAHLLSSHATSGPQGRWLTASMQPQAAIEPGLDRGLAWILADDGRVAHHHGFTGTSLYLAPATGRYLAICTNAVYHHRDNRTRLAPLRALALKAITGEPVGAPN
ncbi:serine hydrolase domain-containing protein [Kitasatospora viridis]|uniref:CubicO group peptidase (Beta-lactamase class C family) n=1 Tax=Kitasatospora viridis TaxID=281105 RepID=A0A561T709_9ACTN|nr:serine hydrolase domain-containing protein [Kitasatospora viridis]TWF82901.1 CubicO group peptidase (beta-lactamase class C family) [Kitasatospora viridis]